MSFYQQIAGQRRPNSAFTLFELIGVLAIISIILAMVAPMTLQMLKLQRQQADKAALPEIAQALKLAMLREQSFPDASTDTDLLFWSTMAARHGAGSANEIRYSDNQQSVERRLYFAGPTVDTAFAGNSFFDIVSGAVPPGEWLADFDDPRELRLLLLSTINPDLPLPSTLSTAEFDAIWESWSNAPGAPTASDVGSFGLTAAWEGRAGELNIERIDLRDFLCQVAIENAYYADGFYDSSGQLKGSFSASDFGFSSGSDYLRDSVQIGTENLAGAKVALNLVNSSIVTETLDPGPPPVTIAYEATRLDATDTVLVLNAGRVIDETSNANIRIRLQTVDVSGPVSSIAYTFTVYDASATNSRAPIDLIHPSGGTNHPLSFTDRYSKRYFLSGQTLLLGIPWNNSVAGTVPITDNQSTLRFDGLSWHY